MVEIAREFPQEFAGLRLEFERSADRFVVVWRRRAVWWQVLLGLPIVAFVIAVFIALGAVATVGAFTRSNPVAFLFGLVFLGSGFYIAWNYLKWTFGVERLEVDASGMTFVAKVFFPTRRRQASLSEFRRFLCGDLRQLRGYRHSEYCLFVSTETESICMFTGMRQVAISRLAAMLNAVVRQLQRGQEITVR